MHQKYCWPVKERYKVRVTVIQEVWAYSEKWAEDMVKEEMKQYWDVDYVKAKEIR